MSVRLVISVAVTVAVLAGCDGTVRLDVGSAEPKLAVYAFPNPDSTWDVTVYRTARLGEATTAEELALESATVTVMGGGSVDTLRAAAPGRYIHASIPTVGTEYTLTVSSTGLGTAAARAPVPKRPEVVVKAEQLGSDGFEERVRLRITLSDESGLNYYRIGVYEFVPPDLRQGGIAWRPAFFESDDPSLRSSAATVGGVELEGERGAFRIAYLGDDLFEGETRIIELITAFDASGPDPSLPEVRVVVSALSPAYLEYHRRLDLQRLNDDDPLADPVALFNNVEGGVGVLGPYANTVTSLFGDEAR